MFACFHRKHSQGEVVLPENKKAKTTPPDPTPAPDPAPDSTPVAAPDPAPDPVTEETYFCAPTQAYDWDDSDEEPDQEAEEKPDQEAEEKPVELAAAAEEEEAEPLTRTQSRRPIIVRGRDSDDEPLG
jgi:hypothetical protein